VIIRHGTGSTTTTWDGDSHRIGRLGRIQVGRCNQGLQISVVDASVANIVGPEDLVLTIARRASAPIELRGQGSTRKNGW
jgi:hypothetical protein